MTLLVISEKCLKKFFHWNPFLVISQQMNACIWRQKYMFFDINTRFRRSMALSHKTQQNFVFYNTLYQRIIIIIKRLKDQGVSQITSFSQLFWNFIENEMTLSIISSFHRFFLFRKNNWLFIYLTFRSIDSTERQIDFQN